VSPIKKFILLPKYEKHLFIEAIIYSFYARWLILCMPFKTIEKKMGNKTQNPSLLSNHKIDNEKLIYIKRAILRAAKWSLWQNKCFEQSLTAAYFLRKYKIPYQLYLGLLKENKKLHAHVWIESNGYFLVEKGKKNFVTLAIYYFP